MTLRMMGASSGSVKRWLEGIAREGLVSSRTTCLRRGFSSRVRSQWVMMQPQVLAAATSTIAGLVKPVTSLMIDAPSRTHILATSGWRVSIEMMASGTSARILRMTGTTRAPSSLAVTGVKPGRVDSPPTSMMSAPSSSIWSARATAASTSRFSPPSEKESGVTLRMPMMRGRVSESSWSPHCQTAYPSFSMVQAFLGARAPDGFSCVCLILL